MSQHTFLIDTPFVDGPTGISFAAANVVVTSIVIIPGMTVTFTIDIFVPNASMAAVRNRQLSFAPSNAAFSLANFDLANIMTSVSAMISGAVQNTYAPDSIVN